MARRLYCKLTDKDSYTRRGMTGETLWGAGVTHGAPGQGALCTAGWIHAYTHPLLAAFVNPIHANLNPETMRLWRVRLGGRRKYDYELKVGSQRVTTIAEIPLPKIDSDTCVRFAILCALSRKQSKSFTTWAHDWLSGADRTRAAARAAAWAAARAAEEAAARAARAAAEAAEARAAARAAAWAAEARAAWEAAEAAEAAARAAAAEAARWAEAAEAATIDLIALARQAVRDEAKYKAAKP